MADLRKFTSSLMVTTTLVTGKFIEIVQNSLESFYDGIVPHLLGYDGMQSLINTYYSNDGTYTSVSYNTPGFFLWEKSAIDEYIKKDCSYMILAAGSGREVIALFKRGVKVDAWECNPQLREFGNNLLKEEGLPCQIQLVNPNEFPIIGNENRYDGCIVGWSAYCHILKKKDRINLLSNIRKIVEGFVLVSFVGRKEVSLIKKVLRKMFSFFCVIEEIDLDLVAKPGMIRVGFDEKKITEEAKAAGFKVVKYNNNIDVYPHAVLIPAESANNIKLR